LLLGDEVENFFRVCNGCNVLAHGECKINNSGQCVNPSFHNKVDFNHLFRL
jgi:hypothetical protein